MVTSRQRDTDRAKLLTRRAVLLAGGKLALLSTLVGRLYYLQVLESDRYTMLAEDNRINMRLLPPQRGLIIDRNGESIASNQQNYRVVVVSEQTRDLEATLNRLGALITVGERDRRRVLREARRKRGFVPVMVRENLSWEEVARVEINAPDLPGVGIEVGLSRHYPHGPAAAHVLGYVAAVSESELTGDPLLELPEFKVGKNGVEKTYDLTLRGTAGTSQVEVNALGRVVRELGREEGQMGRPVALTLDMGLQRYVMDRLGEESASVAVLDVHTGAVLALASNPSFDPNHFSKGLSAKDWEEMLSNPRAPLTNKVIAGQYAPGSTFKVCVALAGLESGIITPSHRATCIGHIEVGDLRLHCWKHKGGHGTLDLYQAIARSCDVYFYDVARRVGLERIAQTARKLGLGAPTGIDIPGERSGLVPSREWKLAAVGQPWQLTETLMMGMGQSYILATPLQLAVMAARIGNGGNLVKPHLSRDLAAAERVGERVGQRAQPRLPHASESLGFSPANLAVIQRGMYMVSNEQGGSAYASRIADSSLAMAGKTGSVQVRRITMAERLAGLKKQEDLPWHERDHALFIAYAPVDRPRFACSVVIEHGIGGARAAAPVARDVLIEAQKLIPIRARAVAEARG
jgi:penicillin-binding protein 2